MATRKLTPEHLQAVTRLAKQWGKIIVRHAFGEQGPGLDVDFVQMEAVAHAAAQGLTAGAIEAATAQQSRQLAERQSCPQCDKLCMDGGRVLTRTPEQGVGVHGRANISCIAYGNCDRGRGR